MQDVRGCWRGARALAAGCLGVALGDALDGLIQMEERRMKVANIVVATDLSDHAGNAARWAQVVSQLLGARVVVAHTVELSIPNWFKGRFEALDDKATYEKIEHKVRAWYQRHTGVQPAEVAIDVGDSGALLVGMATRYPSPLLVFSRTGKDAVRRLLVGSTAQALISEAGCPMVCVHPEQALPQVGATTIAVAIDLTTVSDNAFEFAADMARALGVTLEIIHASGTSLSVIADDLPEHLRVAAVTEQARVALDAFLTRHTDALQGLSFRTHIQPAKPVAAISDFVEEAKVNLIILGHFDRKSMVDNLFRRVTVRVLGNIDATMVVIPGVYTDA
jgi:nucleotide-binding universal stress UspA family protein